MKSGSKADLDRTERTIYHCAEALRIAGILLQPYMPQKASQLLDIIGVSNSRRTFKDSAYGCDNEYGQLNASAAGPLGLFPPLPVE